MMKSKDLSAATSLLIQGYLRANGEDGLRSADEKQMLLASAIQAIRQECSDWAENLEGAASIKASQGAL
jgi:hypothetical protein